MHFLSVASMRAAEVATVATGVCSFDELMARAGRGVARIAALLADARGTRHIVVLVGKGNNGGDALVAARLLCASGFQVDTLLTTPPETFIKEAAVAWHAFVDAGCRASSFDEAPLVHHAVIIDGLLGTGCRGVARGTAAEAITWINAQRPYATVLAVDLPSGMNGDSGVCEGGTVMADFTITFARPKTCFLNDATAAFAGHVLVWNIGIPEVLADATPADASCELIALSEIAPSFRAPSWNGHKKANGCVGIMGGSLAYPNAPVFAALGARAAGAGLIMLATEGVGGAEVLCPEAVRMTPKDVWTQCDTVVAGPGWGISDSSREMLAALLSYGMGKIVLDADALTLLAEMFATRGYVPPQGQRLILTPHPGEAARLLKTMPYHVQADRVGAVTAIAERYHATVVLKGAGTLVASCDGAVWLNRTGNPDMAIGGMGDVLAGCVAARWARVDAPCDAARAAVWLHSTAADVAWRAKPASDRSVACVASQIACVARQLERGL